MTDEKRLPNAFLDDIAKLAAGAAGLAQGARQEAETLIRSRLDRFASSREWVTREEFDAVREMAILALEENKKLSARIESIEQRVTSTS